MKVWELIEKLYEQPMEAEVYVDPPECEDGPLPPELVRSVHCGTDVLIPKGAIYVELSIFP